MCFLPNWTPPIVRLSLRAWLWVRVSGVPGTSQRTQRAARGRRVGAEQVWGCPLCVCVCVFIRVPETPWERPHAQL